MATLTHNAHEIAVRIGAMGAAAVDELEAEHAKQAQLLARAMRAAAPKFQSLLTNSIHVEEIGPLHSLVRPAMDYAIYREKGTKPGKGLPRFEDPAASDIVRWLERRAFAGSKTPRKGSKQALARSAELRDRYEALAWHVRHHGTKATPFVEPTAVAMAPTVAAALRLSVLRGIERAGAAS